MVFLLCLSFMHSEEKSLENEESSSPIEIVGNSMPTYSGL